MLTLPIEGVSLQDIKRVTEILIKSGSDVTNINLVRQSLSSIHGGGLANLVSSTQIISFILSDNVQIGPQAVGSGLTFPSMYHAEDVLETLDAHLGESKLYEKFRQSLINRGRSHFTAANARNITIGTPKDVLKYAKVKAEHLGYRCFLITDELQGEGREIAKFLGNIYRFFHSEFPNEKVCVISTGEVTISVKNSVGRGGRCQELAWAMAKEIKGLEYSTFLSYATDGCDFIKGVGGAWVTNKTYELINTNNLSWKEILDTNNSNYGLKKIHQLISGIETNTNLCDIYIWCSNPKEEEIK